jgi:streptogramin lyase
VFKSASWDGDRLLLCTQTEVLVVDPTSGHIERTVSHPWFNDVHHVARLRGRLHVVSTGLDALLVLDDDDRIAEVHGATARPVWDRFDPEVDYRLLLTTKPHAAHPNYVFEADGTRWLTRFEQGDALRIDTQGAPLPVAQNPIHDGVPVNGSVWFTVVSGKVVRADPRTGATEASWDLEVVAPEGTPLGWCRGIRVEPERVLLGFTRIRPTLFKQNLSWLRVPLGRPEPLPTRVAAYDLRVGRKMQSWDLEEVGMSAIFSILPAVPDPG